MIEALYQVEADRDSFYATCQHDDCPFRSRRRGSREKATRAVLDHLRDVHGVD